MAQVFLSYAREDSAKAQQVAQALAAAGIEVFWDNEIPPGTTWADYIEQKLTQCKALIVLWSEHSTKSQWVREEARLGRDKGVLIPAMIDTSPAPFGFGEVQGANLADWNGDAEHPTWRRFVEAIRAAMTREPAPQRPQAAMSAQPRSRASEQIGAPARKGVPMLAWIIGGVTASVALLAVVGSMLPDQPPVATTAPTQAMTTQPPAVTQPQQPVGDRNWQQTLAMRLQEASAVLGQQGYQLVGQPYSNSMQTGQSQNLPVEMNIGYEFQIVGVCDADCGDLDIRLYGGDGSLIVEDTSTNNQPNVGVIPSTSGTFNIQVHMYACSVAPCFYAVQLYARPLQ